MLIMYLLHLHMCYYCYHPWLDKMKTAQLPPSQTLRQVVRRNRQREQTDGSRRSASTTLETVLILLLIYWSGTMSSGMTGQTP